MKDSKEIKEKKQSIKEQVMRIKGRKDPAKVGCKGEKEYYAFLDGRALTRGDAILAHCFVCQGYYVDGKEGCLNKLCPFYKYMPYGETAKKSKEETVNE